MFPEMFKVSQNCKVPHLNIDNLRDDLYQYGVVGRHDIKTADQLVDWLTRENEALGQKSEKDWKRLFKYVIPDPPLFCCGTTGRGGDDDAAPGGFSR